MSHFCFGFGQKNVCETNKILQVTFNVQPLGYKFE